MKKEKKGNKTAEQKSKHTDTPKKKHYGKKQHMKANTKRANTKRANTQRSKSKQPH